MIGDLYDIPSLKQPQNTKKESRKNTYSFAENGEEGFEKEWYLVVLRGIK